MVSTPLIRVRRGLFGAGSRRSSATVVVRDVLDFLPLRAVQRQTAFGRRERIARLPNQQFVSHRHFVEPDAQQAPVFGRLAHRVVVHELRRALEHPEDTIDRDQEERGKLEQEKRLDELKDYALALKKEDETGDVKHQ